MCTAEPLVPEHCPFEV